MTTVTRKGVWAHKRRLLATCSAVVLGVAFLSGTLVVGDTTRQGFDDLFVQANEGTDALVRGDRELGSEETSQRNPVDAGLLDTVRAVDGVAAAAPSVEGFAQLVGADGERLGGDGPPTLAGNWIDDPALNPYRLVEGRAPGADGEVIIDRRSSAEGDLPLGSTTTVFTPEPLTVTVVGIATFGDEDSLGPVTYTAFTLDEAERLLMARPGQLSGVVARAEPGVSQTELVDRIDDVLPAGAEAVTGAQLTDEANADIEDAFLGFFETLLLVFAGIALLVATFSIYNTFSILVAQRSRESALLRAIGASRGQILRSITLEAVIVGVVASALGIGAGIGLAAGLLALMDAAGMAMPSAGLVVGGGSVAVAAVVGVVVTLVASTFPAIKGSRVPPLAALRDVALDRSGTSKLRAALGVLVTGGGVAVVLAAASAGGDTSHMSTAALGAALSVAGLVILGPVVARPAAAVLGAPLPVLRGLSGSMARANAMRNPRRTAGTASALMVGVAVVALFTTLAASFKSSIEDTGARNVRGDLVIATRDFSGAGLSPSLPDQIRAVPEVGDVVGLGFGTALVDGDPQDVAVVDTEGFTAVMDLQVLVGSMEAMADDALAVSAHLATERGWALGDDVTLAFADGSTEPLHVAAIYDSRALLGDVVVPTRAWAGHVSQQRLEVVAMHSAPGVDLDVAKAAVQQVAEAAGAPDVQDRQEYIDSVSAEIDQALTVVYGLLALAVIIALMGIANTLALSIHERTRELGLLRAVGQTRRQTRTMVRWESVIIAAFGTIGGVGLGVFLGWGLVRSTASSGGLQQFTAPGRQLAAIVVIGALAGVLAGLRPARRAARIDVLRAIASD